MPPTRRLRFMPPTPFRYATNITHEARHFGPICMQRWPLDFEPQATSGSGSSSGYSSYSSSSSSSSLSAPPSGASLRSRDGQLGRVKQDGELAGSWRDQNNTFNAALARWLDLTRRLMPRETFSRLRPQLARLASLKQSEDCLNLNVYTPVEALRRANAKEGHQLPVLVLLHGDSFEFGAGSALEPRRFVERDKLLVVTLNFRLNILGFPPQVAGASRSNLGLMDQVAALHWIRDNIASFGGSPDSVTLMGTQKSAIFVNLLMVSPLAKGLFGRAIIEDGSALAPPLLATTSGPAARQLTAAARHFRLLAKLAECPAPGGHAHAQTGPAAAAAAAAAPATPADEGGAHEGADWAALECLRQRPIEQLMLRLPLELLQLNSSLADPALAPLWAPRLAALLGEQSPAGSGPAALAATLRRLTKRLASSDLDEPTGSELLELVFGPPTGPRAHWRPLFGPQLEGTLAPDEELSSALLGSKQSGLLFQQRDLLAGLSRPPTSLAAVAEPPPVTPDTPPSLIRASGALSDKLSARAERSGLSGELAIGWLNAFVGSSYSYHQQEIVNSIVSQYLSSWGPANRKSSSVAQQQRRLLELLGEALDDALINVPTIKLVLIHATRQLDSLLEPFVSYKFGQLGHAPSPVSDSLSPSKLLDSFAQFARVGSEWSPELANRAPVTLGATSGSSYPTPRTSFLYQLDAGQLADIIAGFVARLELDKRATGGRARRLLGDKLRAMLAAGRLGRLSLGLGCTFEWPDVAGWEHQDENHEASQSDKEAWQLEARLRAWICARLGTLVANFARSGNPNVAASLASSSLEIDDPLALDSRILHFEDTCLAEGSSTTGNATETERGLEIGSERSSGVEETEKVENEIGGESGGSHSQTGSASGRCDSQLRQLAFDYLTVNLDEHFEHRDARPSWPNLSPFNELELASIPSPKGFWRLGRLDEPQASGSSSDVQMTLAGRMSFWANFVGALNCSRTQPIIAGHLLFSGQQDSNSLNGSALANLNLASNCLQPIKSAQDYVTSLMDRARRMIEQRLASQTRQPLSKGHNMLRMASSSSNSSDDPTSGRTDSSQQESSHGATGDQQASLRSADGGNLSALAEPKLLGVESRQFWPPNYVGVVLIACLLVISITLASGVCAIAMRRRRPSNQAESQPDSQTKDKVNRDLSTSGVNTSSGYSSNGKPDADVQASQFVFAAGESSIQSAMALNSLVGVPEGQLAPSMHSDTLAGVQSTSQLGPAQHQQLVGDASAFQIHFEEPATLDGELVYWTDHQALGPDGSQQPLALCKSHSLIGIQGHANLYAHQDPMACDLDDGQFGTSGQRLNSSTLFLPLFEDPNPRSFQGKSHNDLQVQTTMLDQNLLATSGEYNHRLAVDEMNRQPMRSGPSAKTSSLKKRVTINNSSSITSDSSRLTPSYQSQSTSGSRQASRVSSFGERDLASCPLHGVSKPTSSYYVNQDGGLGDSQVNLDYHTNSWNRQIQTDKAATGAAQGNMSLNRRKRRMKTQLIAEGQQRQTELIIAPLDVGGLYQQYAVNYQQSWSNNSTEAKNRGQSIQVAPNVNEFDGTMQTNGNHENSLDSSTLDSSRVASDQTIRNQSANDFVNAQNNKHCDHDR